jgi:hypothetical protein
MSHFCIKTMILPRQAWDKHIGKAPKTEMMTTMRFFKQGESAGRSAEDYGPACQGTANCIIIDHFLHLNRGWSPRFSTLRDKNGWVRAKTA